MRFRAIASALLFCVVGIVPPANSATLISQPPLALADDRGSTLGATPYAGTNDAFAVIGGAGSGTWTAESLTPEICDNAQWIPEFSEKLIWPAGVQAPLPGSEWQPITQNFVRFDFKVLNLREAFSNACVFRVIHAGDGHYAEVTADLKIYSTVTLKEMSPGVQDEGTQTQYDGALKRNVRGPFTINKIVVVGTSFNIYQEERFMNLYWRSATPNACAVSSSKVQTLGPGDCAVQFISPRISIGKTLIPARISRTYKLFTVYTKAQAVAEQKARSQASSSSQAAAKKSAAAAALKAKKEMQSHQIGKPCRTKGVTWKRGSYSVVCGKVGNRLVWKKYVRKPVVIDCSVSTLQRLLLWDFRYSSLDAGWKLTWTLPERCGATVKLDLTVICSGIYWNSPSTYEPYEERLAYTDTVMMAAGSTGTYYRFMRPAEISCRAKFQGVDFEYRSTDIYISDLTVQKGVRS